MDWSPKQQQALDSVGDWLKNKDKPFYYLAGYAGTGKTTLARHLAQDLKTAFGAYTGKAALVMQKHGIPTARTIHSLMYKLVPPNEAKIKELEDSIKDQGFSKDLIEELKRLKQPRFEINEESELYDVDLIVLDEISMVNEEMGNDVLSFGKPVLVLGDPMQLPPVKGTGYFLSERPDALLTEIHRQAEGNPIIALSKHVREKGNVPVNFADNAGRVPRQRSEDFTDGSYQFLTGKNVTRNNLNQRLRAKLGYSGIYPQPGESLICLKNSTKDRQLYNGMFVVVNEVTALEDNFLLPLDITTEMSVSYEDVPALASIFDNSPPIDEVPYFIIKEREQFDYGYCITVHKAQGSQFDKVVLFDDGFLSWKADDRRRWLYTAVTRAVDEVYVV